MECMAQHGNAEYGMYERRDGMECMPKMRDEEYGMYAQNEG